MGQEAQALVAALGLATVHLVSGRMGWLGGVPRSRWLSAFGGISVAYVLVHLLPELAEGQEAVARREGALAYLEDHVYVMALAGLAFFYGVENHSLRSRRRRARAGEDRTGEGAFWLSIASFAVYNAIIGYLLLREELEATTALVTFTVALAVHFVVNDFGLQEHHKEDYERVGRWVISVAVLIGWAAGVVLEVPEHAIALVVAFIGGGVILNVMKEELPGERQARFGPFAASAALYALLLQLV